MANIGSLKFQITANAAQAMQTMTAVVSKVGTTASTITSKVGSIASSLAKGLGGGLLGALTGGAGAIAGVMTSIAGSVISAFQGAPDFLAGVLEKIKALAAVGTKAKSLGVMSDDFMALTKNAGRFGVEAETIEKALFKIGAMESPAMGINLDKWLKADAIGRLKLFSDRLREMPNANDRINAVGAAFGKLGVAMLPVLLQGSAAIDAFTARQRMMGLAIGPADMAKLMRAKASIPKFNDVSEGIQNKALIAVAPLIESIGNTAQRIMPSVAILVDGAGASMAKFGEITLGLSSIFGDSVKQMALPLLGMNDNLITLKASTRAFEVQMVNSMKTVALTGAVTFDLMKLGIGSMLVTLGEFANQYRTLLAFTNIPAAQALAGNAQAITEAGRKMMGGIGGATIQVLKFFDNLDKGQKNLGDQAEQTAARMVAAYQGVAAMVQGSKEAISVEARFNTENMADRDKFAKAVVPVVQGLAELKKVVEQARDLLRGRGNAADFGAL